MKKLISILICFFLIVLTNQSLLAAEQPSNTAQKNNAAPKNNTPEQNNTQAKNNAPPQDSAEQEKKNQELKKVDISREYHLKAAFLRYVVEFVEWPPEAISDSAVTICVYGEIPSLDGLNSINGKIVNNRNVLIRPIPNISIAKSEKQACQLLYLGNFTNPSIDSILSEMKNLPILTFGDKAGLAEKGGSMNFYVANNRMGIMVNQDTVAENKLKISPRMLKLVTLFPKR